MFRNGIVLTKNFSVPADVGEAKKPRRFDLGSERPPVLVECKSHTWTQGGNMPSAKKTVRDEAIIFTSRQTYIGRYSSPASIHVGIRASRPYLKTRGHLVPASVEAWEYDLESSTGERRFLGHLSSRAFTVTALHDTLASGENQG